SEKLCASRRKSKLKSFCRGSWATYWSGEGAHHHFSKSAVICRESRCSAGSSTATIASRQHFVACECHRSISQTRLGAVTPPALYRRTAGRRCGESRFRGAQGDGARVRGRAWAGA